MMGMDYRRCGFDSRVGVKFWVKLRYTGFTPETGVEVDEGTAYRIVKAEHAAFMKALNSKDHVVRKAAEDQGVGAIVEAQYSTPTSLRVYDLMLREARVLKIGKAPAYTEPREVKP